MNQQTLSVSQALQLAFDYHRAGKLTSAQLIYKQILTVAPDNADALHLLGVIANQRQQYRQAIQLISKAIAVNNRIAHFHCNLGNAFRGQGQLTPALQCYQRTVQLEPQYAEAYYNQGLILKTQGHIPAAITCFQHFLTLHPDAVEGYLQLGSLWRHQGQLTAALCCFLQIARLQPTQSHAFNNLGVILNEQAQFTQASDYFKIALALEPNDAEAHCGLGSALFYQGHIEAALQHYRHALACDPDYKAVHSNYLLALNYSVDIKASQIFEAHCQFAPPPLTPFVHTPQQRTRLRIGYLSPDFREHPVAYFIEPILAHHDHQHFEIFCYDTQLKGDAITQRLKRYADHWHASAQLTDDALAEQIKRDHIDILVDLSGHTANNRLLVFARKPAPVQLSYLGYPNTSGLTAIDYRLVDDYTEPDNQHFSSETVLKMPQSYFCYAPSAEAPAVNALPARQRSFITFGCFNNYCKLNPPLLALWAQILKALPHSRLLIKTKSLDDTAIQKQLQNQFIDLGISPQRLSLVGRVPTVAAHLRYYHEVDIALDSYPFNGATTTCEALWMGAPVVTLVGERHVARMGLSLLSAAGLTDLITLTPTAYVEKAIQLAHQLESLSQLRQNLRAHLQASALLQAQVFTEQLERHYQQIWRGYLRCQSA